MSDQTIEFQAKIYVYDLNNCAREFGFKPDEGWVVRAVNSQEKKTIEKLYFPTLSAKALPDMLAELLASIKFKLSQHLGELEKNLDVNAIRQQALQYLVAYSPARLRR